MRLPDDAAPAVPDVAQGPGMVTGENTTALLADRLPLGSAGDVVAGSDLSQVGVSTIPAIPDASSRTPVPDLGGAAGLPLPIRSTAASVESSGAADSATDAVRVVGAASADTGFATTDAGPASDPAPESSAGIGGQGPGTDVAAAAARTAAAGGAAGAAAAGNPGDIDVLAQRLYEPIARRLRAELRVDRERMGRLVDRPW
jgi:hypothetical protein